MRRWQGGLEESRRGGKRKRSSREGEGERVRDGGREAELKRRRLL